MNHIKPYELSREFQDSLYDDPMAKKVVNIPHVDCLDVDSNGLMSGDLSFITCWLTQVDYIDPKDIQTAKKAVEKDCLLADRSLQRVMAKHRDSPNSRAYFDYVLVDNGYEMLPVFCFEHLSRDVLRKVCFALGMWWDNTEDSCNRILRNIGKKYGASYPSYPNE